MVNLSIIKAKIARIENNLSRLKENKRLTLRNLKRILIRRI